MKEIPKLHLSVWFSKPGHLIEMVNDFVGRNEDSSSGLRDLEESSFRGINHFITDKKVYAPSTNAELLFMARGAFRDVAAFKDTVEKTIGQLGTKDLRQKIVLNRLKKAIDENLDFIDERYFDEFPQRKKVKSKEEFALAKAQGRVKQESTAPAITLVSNIHSRKAADLIYAALKGKFIGRTTRDNIARLFSVTKIKDIEKIEWLYLSSNKKDLNYKPLLYLFSEIINPDNNLIDENTKADLYKTINTGFIPKDKNQFSSTTLRQSNPRIGKDIPFEYLDFKEINEMKKIISTLQGLITK